MLWMLIQLSQTALRLLVPQKRVIRYVIFMFLKLNVLIKLIFKVIQRRGDFGEPRDDFNRNWTDYKLGFGDHNKEFWLGNEQIHKLTKSGDMKLKVELEAWDGRTAWAEYDTFRWVCKIYFEQNKHCYNIQS